MLSANKYSIDIFVWLGLVYKILYLSFMISKWSIAWTPSRRCELVCSGTNFLSWLTVHCVLCCVRYSAVCRPLAYRDSNITERTGTRVAKYVTPVIIFSTIYNIPKFLEYKVSNVRNWTKWSIYHSDKSSWSTLSCRRYLKYFPLTLTAPGCFKTNNTQLFYWLVFSCQCSYV